MCAPERLRCLLPTLAIRLATQHTLALLVVSLFLHLATLKSLPWEVPCLPLVACLALFSVLTVLCLFHIPLSLIKNNNFLTTTLC